MSKVKVLFGGLAALLLVGFAGIGWGAVETVITSKMVASSPATCDSFNKGSVVYVRVNVGIVGGSATATVTDDADVTNQITFPVYDNGTFPDDNPNDGYYWGRFTIEEGDGSGTDEANDILELLSTDTATITCDLDSGSDPGSHSISADFTTFADHDPPEVTNFGANPTPFSPNDDGVQDNTIISYTLCDNISSNLTVRLEIRDSNDIIVKTLIDAVSQNIGQIHSVLWNGKDIDGLTVDDGIYTCRIFVLDEAGNSCEETHAIEVDTHPPVISEVGEDKSGTMPFINPFSPNGDGAKDFTTFWFKLSGAWPEQTKIEICSGATVIRALSGAGSSVAGNVDIEPWPDDPGVDEPATNGTNWCPWNGRDSTDEVVPDGTYSYKIWATDYAGNTESYVGNIEVDTTPPETSITSVKDKNGNPTNYFDTENIPVTITGAASDDNGVQLVTLVINGESFSPTNPNGDWSSWSFNWTPSATSADGRYLIQVKAVDTVENDTGASGACASVIYDNKPPTSEITSPPDGTKFNTDTFTISGTASDGAEGVGVKEVEIQVTNLSTSTVIVSFTTTGVTNTSSDWSTWEYVFDPPDPGSPPVSYLIECRATDNLYDSSSPSSSSHIQASPDSITVIYDIQSPPYHPTDLRDDSVPLSNGHTFGISNILTCNQAYFPGLTEVRFEYKIEPSGNWQVIGSSPYTPPATSYIATVNWDTTALSSDVTYSFRAVAVGSVVPSQVFTGCKIDNTAPTSPYNLKDDGVLITSGHVFGLNNELTAEADTTDISLDFVQFEYYDATNPVSGWQVIASDDTAVGNVFGVPWSPVSLDTTHIYSIRATCVDKADNSTSSPPISNCTIDLDPPIFEQPLSSDKVAYKNGDRITITVNMDDSGYNISGDFSEIDSEYGQGDNLDWFDDLEDSTYSLYYDISQYNSRPDSTYTVVITATNPAGNQVSSSVSVVLDNTAPTASILSPTSGTTLSGTTTFIISDTGNPDSDVSTFTLEYSPTGLSSFTTCPDQTQGAWMPGATSTISFDTSSLGDGTYDFRCKLTDTAGNIGYTLPVYSITLDNGPPPVPTNLIATAISNAKVRLTWQASSPEDDVDHYNIYRSTTPYNYDFNKINEVSKGTYPLEFTDGPLSDASVYYYYITSEDSNGNESSFSNIASVKTDGTSPKFDTPIIPDKPAYKDGDKITLTVNLDDSGYTLSASFSQVDSEYGPSHRETFVDLGNSLYEIYYTISSPIDGKRINKVNDGEHTVTIIASDSVGNQAVSSVSVTLDNTPPLFAQPTRANASAYKNGDVVTLTCFLDASGYTVTANFSSIDSTYTQGMEKITDNGNNTYTINYTISTGNTKPDGEYSISITAEDAAGNKSSDVESGNQVTVCLVNELPQFQEATKVGKFIDYNGNGKIDEGELSESFQSDNYFKNGDIVILQAHLDKQGYATSTSVSVNFLPLDSEYTKGVEQPAIPGDGSASGSSLNLWDNLDNDKDGAINNPEEAKYYLIAYRINAQNTRDDGSYRVRVKVINSVGNSVLQPEVDSPVCKLDNTPPTIKKAEITLISQPDNPKSLDELTAVKEQITKLSVTFDDGEGVGVNTVSSDVVLLDPNNNPVGGATAIREENKITLEWPLTSLPLSYQGKYTVRATAKDLIGNTSDFVNYSFIYDNLLPHLAFTSPADSSTLTSPLTRITATISEDTSQTQDVSGVDIYSCSITLKDEKGVVLQSGGSPINANTIQLQSSSGEFLAGKSGTYFISVKVIDYAGNQSTYTHSFSLRIDPFKDVAKASLDYGGKSIYDISSSTNVDNPTSFVKGKLDCVYLKVNLQNGTDLDESASSIFLLKILNVRTGMIEAINITGEAKVNYNPGEGWIELIFYPDSIFNPDVDEHKKDGFYWVKAEVVDTIGNSHQIDLFFVYDTTPPLPPSFKIKSFNKATGTITISGTTQPESSEPQQVQIFINGELKASVSADTTGNFSKEVALKKGKNSINVRAIDRAGNIGDFGSSIKLNYKPDHLLSIVFRSSRILKSGSSVTPVKLIYYLSEPAKVTIRIYNLTGEIVRDWEEYLNLGDEKEWIWWGENMYGDKVNNGVYILRVTAKSSRRQETVVKLVGVLR